MKILILSLFALSSFAFQSYADNNCDNIPFTVLTPTIDAAKKEKLVYSYCEERGTDLYKYTVSNTVENNTYNTIYIDLYFTAIDSPIQPASYFEKKQEIDILSTIYYKHSDFDIVVRDASDKDSEKTIIGKGKFKITNIDTTKKSGALSDPSGTWYQPSLSGTGFVIMQYDNGTVIQYYGYDSDGKRLWLLSDTLDEAWVRGKTKTLTMYEGQADKKTDFNTPPANSPGIIKWGKVEIRFDSCNKASAKLSGTDGEQIFSLVKLANPTNIYCLENP